MITQLQELFGDKLITATHPFDTHTYKWFTNGTSPYIGIEASSLSAEQEALLRIFLPEFQIADQHLSKEQQQWKVLLFDKPNQLLNENTSFSGIRFIHFSFKSPIQDQLEFEQALSGLYHTDVIILWESRVTGVLIEKIKEPDDPVHSISDVIDVLTSDFGSSMQFFEGQAYKLPFLAGQFFQQEKKWFMQSKEWFSTQRVFSMNKLLPFLLLQEASPLLKEQLSRVIDFIAEDEEMIHTIKTFLECNMNVSLTAKTLYMHRNSLQYRIDRFILRTGLDIKRFSEAITAYLAIMSIQRL